MAGSVCYFDTALGRCGLAWTERGVAGCLLPRADGSAAGHRFGHRHPGWPLRDPTSEVRQLIVDVTALLCSQWVDLGYARLDLRGVPAFHCLVYNETRRIAPGQTMSYGELAARLGDVALARAVGQALAANPIAIIVPCHRVLASGGRAGGFSAPGGVATKLKLLAIERARIGREPTLFDL